MLFQDELIIVFELKFISYRDEIHYQAIGTSREIFGDLTQKNTIKKKEELIKTFNIEFDKGNDQFILSDLEGHLEKAVQKMRERRQRSLSSESSERSERSDRREREETLSEYSGSRQETLTKTREREERESEERESTALGKHQLP